jgi:hypothetical protein
MNWKRRLLLVILAIILGIGIAAWRISRIEHSPAMQTYGSWRGTTNLPLNKDDLVTTQVTLFALFALPSHEAVYLFAASDEGGKRLTGDNSYVIEGNINTIKAEYWSITAYGKDLYLMPNAAHRFSFSRDNLQTDSLGNFKIVLSAQKAEGNWLPVMKDKKFELVLRIYHGDADFMDHLDKANLPVIKPL